MHALRQRIENLQGLHVRVHVNEGNEVSTVDGVCQGVEGDCVVLSPSTAGERVEVPLGKVGALTQLAGAWEG